MIEAGSKLIPFIISWSLHLFLLYTAHWRCQSALTTPWVVTTLKTTSINKPHFTWQSCWNVVHLATNQSLYTTFEGVWFYHCKTNFDQASKPHSLFILLFCEVRCDRQGVETAVELRAAKVPSWTWTGNIATSWSVLKSLVHHDSLAF